MSGGEFEGNVMRGCKGGGRAGGEGQIKEDMEGGVRGGGEGGGWMGQAEAYRSSAFGRLHTKAFGVISAPSQPEIASELWAEISKAQARLDTRSLACIWKGRVVLGT